jgi:hypothetical protein
MASEKELLDKADALLRRHALGTGGETGTYPVLTDLVVPPELAAADEKPPQPAAGDRLHDEVVTRVLAHVKARLGVELERRVAESLAPKLREAVKEALAGIEEQLAAAVADAVKRSMEEGPVK